MTQKTLLATVVAGFLFFACLTAAIALDIRGIEAVRAKKVLGNGDLQEIDTFLAQATGEMLATVDFSSISNIRSLIIANSTSNEPGQVQFDQQFSESAKKHISAALERAGSLTPSARSFRVVINFLMLLDGLADPRLVELPLKYIDHNNVVVSYWAVHCLTNPEIVNKLNVPNELDTARQIARRLEAIVETCSPDTLGLIVGFAGSVRVSDGEDLLLKVADRRIASYADWSVQYELLDATILQLLSDKMVSSNPGKAAAGRRFGQLLSYVFQRYIKGADVLSPSQKEQLASVLVEIERSSLSKLTGKPSSAIKKAIESGDLTVLLEEHNNLLGDSTKLGQLPVDVNFDYGKDGSGAALTYPLGLSSPPQTVLPQKIDLGS
jgi:hypothetical protein